MLLVHKDKFDHFMYWFFGSTLLLQFTENTGLVFIIAMMLAVGKEIYDGSNNTMREHYLDAAAGMIGAIVALAMESI